MTNQVHAKNCNNSCSTCIFFHPYDDSELAFCENAKTKSIDKPIGFIRKTAIACPLHTTAQEDVSSPSSSYRPIQKEMGALSIKRNAPLPFHESSNFLLKGFGSISSPTHLITTIILSIAVLWLVFLGEFGGAVMVAGFLTAKESIMAFLAQRTVL